VEQIQAAFGYYHVHIYLVDENSGDLRVAGGTGKAGQALLAGGHKIPRGKGLMGRAATTNAVVLVPDVSQDADWLSHPLLPDTRSEVVVPIASGGRVLGVLDVQHHEVGGLSEDDANLLGAVASQVAIALQNTRAFAETRQRAEHEALVGQIAQHIQGTLTIEDALQTAARELGHALGAQRASVQLALAAQPAHGRE
jgi:two-component system sensor histidine kinase/response regulator